MDYLLHDHGRLQFQELQKNMPDSIGERNYLVNVGLGIKSVRRHITLHGFVFYIKYFFQSDWGVTRQFGLIVK